MRGSNDNYLESHINYCVSINRSLCETTFLYLTLARKQDWKFRWLIFYAKKLVVKNSSYVQSIVHRHPW